MTGLSDEWFASQFMGINSRLGKIESTVGITTKAHKDDVKRITLRLVNLEKRKVVERGGIVKDWKYWSKESGKIIGILSIMSYIAVDIWNKITGRI